MKVSMENPEFKDLPEQNLSQYMAYLFRIYSAFSELFYIVYLYPYYTFHGKGFFTCQIPVNSRDKNPWIIRMIFSEPLCVACFQCEVHLLFNDSAKFFHHAHRIVGPALRYVFYNEFCKVLEDGYIVVYYCLYIRPLNFYHHIFSIHC